MVNLILKRGPIEESGIYGTLTSQDKEINLVTLENAALYIPAGSYSLSWHISPHLNGERVPILNNVPARAEILIHQGNFQTDSEGCILVGGIRDGNAIDSSVSALNTLISYINSVDSQLANSSITILPFNS